MRLAFLAGGFVVLLLAACGDKSLVDPLAEQEKGGGSGTGAADVGDAGEVSSSETVVPLALGATYSLEREVDKDDCNLTTTVGTRVTDALNLEQDATNLNGSLTEANGDKTLLHGSAGAKEFSLTGTDTVADGDCSRSLGITLSGSGDAARIRGTIQTTYTYGDECGVASGQTCSITETFSTP